MFTILNLINYFSGKYIPFYLLILITIGFYYYIISTWLTDILNFSSISIILILILMLIDITSIIIIFSSDYLSETTENNNFSVKKKSKKSSKKSSKKNSKKNSKEHKLLENNNVQNQSNNKINENLDKNENLNDKLNEIISLYDDNNESSIKTYHLM